MKELNCRTVGPSAIPVLSSNAWLPRRLVSPVAAAAERAECPDGYSGNGGVEMSGSQVESMTLRM